MILEKPARRGPKPDRPPKRWCPACKKRDAAFYVRASAAGSGYWAHECCGCKTLSRKPLARGKLPRRERKTSRAKMVREADALWAQIVRRPGVCDFDGCGLFPDAYDHECFGSLQAMHGISRRYYGTRWLLINGFCGCQRVHLFYTMRPQEWDRFLVAAWGLRVWEELWSRARTPLGKVDVQAALDKLREEAK